MVEKKVLITVEKSAWNKFKKNVRRDGMFVSYIMRQLIEEYNKKSEDNDG